MIWSSMPLMTVLDLVIVSMGVYSLSLIGPDCVKSMVLRLY